MMNKVDKFIEKERERDSQTDRQGETDRQTYKKRDRGDRHT